MSEQVVVSERAPRLKKVEKGDTLLQVRNLKMYFPVTEGILFQKAVGHVKAVDDVTFEIKKGETLGLVGESGCGKTTAAYGILQLVQAPGYIVHGEIILNGANLLDLEEKALRKLRHPSRSKKLRSFIEG